MNDKVIVGLTEKIMIKGREKNIEVVARIDTGATKSSIDTKLAGELELGPIIRTKMVKSASGTNVRPVIKSHITLHGKDMEVEFTLADRSHMRFQVLIGQDVLKQGFLIDPAK